MNRQLFLRAAPWFCGLALHETQSDGEHARDSSSLSTVRAENISELIPAARKIEFESCK